MMQVDPPWPIRPPNTRAQRTRSSPSIPHSPLTRCPSGGLWLRVGLLGACALIIVGILTPVNATGREVDEKEAVERVVRQSEGAVASLDCSKIDFHLAPDARWIERSYPQPASAAKWCEQARVAGVRIEYKLHDFDVQVHGDVAWVTLIIDGSFHAGTPEARKLMGHAAAEPAEWQSTSAESIVLRKVGGSWKMVLGHSSIVPKVQDTP